MPTTRTRRGRNRRSTLTAAMKHMLLAGTTDGVGPDDPKDGDSFAAFLLAGDRRALEKLWREVRGELMATWLKERPGERPHSWWLFDAPPAAPGDVPETMTRHAGRVICHRRRVDGGAAPDAIPATWTRHGAQTTLDEDAVVESQASFLRRHGLLSPVEERKLPAEAFEPETITGDLE